MPRNGVRVPPKWDPDVFDLKKERRAFDIDASPAEVVEQRFGQARRVAEFWASLEAIALTEIDPPALPEIDPPADERSCA